MDPNLTSNLDSGSQTSGQNQKKLLLIIGGVVVLFIALYLVVLLSSDRTTKQEAGVISTTPGQSRNINPGSREGTNPVSANPEITSVNLPPRAGSLLFSDTPYYGYSYQFFPGRAEPKVQAIIDDLVEVKTSSLGNGAYKVELIAKKQKATIPSFVVYPGDKIYLVVKGIDNEAQSHLDIGDVAFAQVDEKGYVIEE